MKKSAIYTLLAVLILLGACVGVYKLLNRGAPVTPAIKTVEAAEKEAGNELTAIADPTGGVAGMELVAGNSALGLYMNRETAQIAVKERAGGRVWHSNPVGLNEDGMAQPFEKGSMASQFTLAFRDSLTNLATFRSFPDSVEKKQFTLEGIKDGVRVTYTLGDSSKGVDALPKAISKARFQEKVTGKLDEATAKYVSIRYYPSRSNPDILERLDEQVSKELVLKKMLDAFAKAGYTEEDLAFDNEENGAGGASGEGTGKPKFVVPLEYHLVGDRLSVRIPVGSIEEAEGFSIRTIELMNFFGAAGTAEQGYMLVPDGSGSLIYLNNGKIHDDPYSQVVYGPDQTDNTTRRAQVSESARLPVFGLKAADSAWYGVISKGEALASVNADIAGKTNAYNHAYASFQVRGEDTIDMFSGGKSNEIPILTDALYGGDIEVQYGFLAGKSASYAGMAAAYRDMITEEEAGMRPITADSGKLPFYVDVVGAVTKTKSILGVPYESQFPVTTFKEAGVIADALQQQGVANIRMRLVGWSAGGVYHEPAAAKPLGKLGGTAGMKSLAAKLDAGDGGLYPDTAFQHVYEDTMAFAPSSDAARFVTRQVALQAPINRALNRMDEELGTYYLLSPSKLPAFVDRFSRRYERLKLPGLSLRDLGDVVNGDYRDSRTVNRQTAKAIAAGQLGKLSERYPELMVEGGNGYALPYARHIVGAPMASSGFNLADEAVPFYELVVHGFADYAGEPINLAADQSPSRQLLKLLEYGASPRFIWTYAPSSELKFTKFDYLYSTQYADWLQQAVALYKEADQALAPLRSIPMTDHERLQDGVYRSTFANGTTITVNYNETAVAAGGRSIGPGDYAIGGEGA